METITSTISFDIELSEEEMVAIKRMLSGNEVKFTVLKDARMLVKVQIEVKDK